MRSRPLMQIEYHDDGPDKEGKRRFCLHWTERDFATFRKRAQEFHADPAPYLKEHPELKTSAGQWPSKKENAR